MTEIRIEALDGKVRTITGIIKTRDNGERYVITTRGTVYEIDNDKVFKIRRRSHTATIIGYII